MTATRSGQAADLRRWRRYLASERAEAAVYRDIAERRSGEEREILLALAEAEKRHAAHWEALLGADAGSPPRVDLRTQLLSFLARHLGSVFVIALVQRAEARSPYEFDSDATAAMAADERIHEEVVRGLAARGRQRLSGSFRAAVFGANDGLVSNLSLVLGVSAGGVSDSGVLVAGIAGLLAGALSMASGEFVSVSSQRELLEASNPSPEAQSALEHLDLNANELALVFRARGMPAAEAEAHAVIVLSDTTVAGLPLAADAHEAIGSGTGAAASSFLFFASGAAVPILPFIVGLSGRPALVAAAVLVGLALLVTGAIVGLLSGGPPLRRGLRQLAIGYGAAAITYLLGLVFGSL